MTTTGSGGESPIEIVELARRNQAFRREVVTGDHSQVVVTTIPAGTRHDIRQEADAAEGH